WGSSPRPTGSQLAVNDEMSFVGSVSGGCVEGVTIRTALEIIRTGGSRRLSFGISNDEAWTVGLPCGGQIELLVERARPELVRQLEEDRQKRRTVVVATELSSGRHRMIYPLEGTTGVARELARAAEDASRRDESTLVVDGEGEEWFLRVHHPPRRM